MTRWKVILSREVWAESGFSFSFLQRSRSCFGASIVSMRGAQMICKKEIMPVGSDEYACEFRNFDFHERRAASEENGRKLKTS